MPSNHSDIKRYLQEFLLILLKFKFPKVRSIKTKCDNKYELDLKMFLDFVNKLKFLYEVLQSKVTSLSFILHYSYVTSYRRLPYSITNCNIEALEHLLMTGPCLSQFSTCLNMSTEG